LVQELADAYEASSNRGWLPRNQPQLRTNSSKAVPNSAGLKVIKLKPVASNNDQTSFGHERKKLMDIDAKKVAYEKQHKDKIFQMIK
jgi:hypothetical protein